MKINCKIEQLRLKLLSGAADTVPVVLCVKSSIYIYIYIFTVLV